MASSERISIRRYYSHWTCFLLMHFGFWSCRHCAQLWLNRTSWRQSLSYLQKQKRLDSQILMDMRSTCLCITPTAWPQVQRIYTQKHSLQQTHNHFHSTLGTNFATVVIHHTTNVTLYMSLITVSMSFQKHFHPTAVVFCTSTFGSILLQIPVCMMRSCSQSCILATSSSQAPWTKAPYPAEPEKVGDNVANKAVGRSLGAECASSEGDRKKGHSGITSLTNIWFKCIQTFYWAVVWATSDYTHFNIILHWYCAL